MKIFLCLLIALFGTTALASSTHPIFDSQKLTYGLYKSVVVLNGDAYSFERTKVCSGTVNIYSWDLRNMPGGFTLYPQPICQVEQDGKMIQFSMAAAVFVAERDPSEKTIVTKNYFAALAFQNIDNSLSVYPRPMPASASTRNLQNESMIIEAYPDQQVNCGATSAPNSSKLMFKGMTQSFPSPLGNCEILNPTAFSLVAEFETIK